MTLIEYKKALLKFAPQEIFAAGLELLGHEVKSLREKNGTLDGSRVVVRGGEAWLVGMTIPPYQAKNTPPEYDPERSRRLLMKKQQIAQLADAEAKKGLTIVPLEVYNFHGLIKVKVAIVTGKGKKDKREDLKKRDAERDRDRLLKTR